MGFMDTFFGGGETKTTFAPDPKSAAWQDLWRKSIAGMGGQVFGIPGLSQYAGSGFGANFGLPDYDAARKAMETTLAQQRGFAGAGADDLATKQGAFGGDRAAIFKAQALGEADRNAASTMANFNLGMTSQQWQQAMQLLGMMGGAAQSFGYTQKQATPSNPFGQIAGLGLGFLGIPGVAQKFGLANQVGPAMG